MEKLAVEPLRVHQDADGRFRVAVPKREVAEKLGLKNKQRVRVLVDVQRRRFIYQLVEERLETHEARRA